GVVGGGGRLVDRVPGASQAMLGVRAGTGDAAAQGPGDVGDDGAARWCVRAVHGCPSTGGSGSLKQRAKAGSTSGDPSTRSAPWSAASAGGSPAWMIAARVLGSESIRGGRSREGGGGSEDCGRRWIWKSPRWIRASRISSPI